MENSIKIGVGVVVLAGVGYYFYNKNKKSSLNKPTTDVVMSKTSTFDREKASREFAKFAFPIMAKRYQEQIKNNPLQELKVLELKKYANATGISNAQMTVLANTLNDYRGTVKSTQLKTELELYENMLEMLNKITDDSDAEFFVKEYKKIVEFGDKSYNPDLDTQIRIKGFAKKYPRLDGFNF
jgi:hypothetical protein